MSGVLWEMKTKFGMFSTIYALQLGIMAKDLYKNVNTGA
jgi:hypothetical protein